MALNLTLRKSFLYIFATVGLVLCIISGISFIDLGLKTYVLKKADNFCFNYQSSYPDKDGRMVEVSKAQQEEQKKQCEEQKVANRQSQASNAIAMLVIGLPLYLYHWYTIRKENQI